MSGLFYCHGCKRDLDIKLKHPTKKVNNNYCCVNCSNRKNSFNRLSNAETIIAKLKLEADKADSDAISKKLTDAKQERLGVIRVKLYALNAKKEDNLINKEFFGLDYDLSN